MVTAIVALLLWTGLEAASRKRERAVRRRGAALLAATGDAAPMSRGRGRAWDRLRVWLPGRESGRSMPLRNWIEPLGVLAGAYVLIGGAAGALAGLAGAYGVRRWGRRRKPEGPRAGSGAPDPELPLAADLLAACLSAGAGPREAAGAVGESLDGPVGRRLAQIAAELRLGGEPAEAWGRLGEIPGAAGLARCLERAGSSGAPAAGPVGRVAERCRAERARETAARARQAGVLITGPLGLCFLPAFLAAGVAPVVIGLASGLLKH
ncbi:type II secretion system F family protein [Streptomyces sp. NPDC048696]|uniref:type II secretion system F family protein n=1 Tax=Streptomyces sp. NPDC048696 TaxID=3365585 RepID=UPI003720F7F3